MTTDLRARSPRAVSLPDEGALLDAVRAGSSSAFAVLYEHYRRAALAYARRLASGDDPLTPEDLTETAFTRVLAALRNGNGPSETLRFYLLGTVRHEVWRMRHRQQLERSVMERWGTDEVARRRGTVGTEGAVNATTRHHLLAQAFRSLSPAWRNVLWMVEVEGRDTSEIASILGLSPNAAAALAYRARRGLRSAYLGISGQQAGDECSVIAGRLADFLAGSRPKTHQRDPFEDVRAHLLACPDCRDIVRGVDTASSDLGAVAAGGMLRSRRRDGERWETPAGDRAEGA